jgi:uncharacterized protein
VLKAWQSHLLAHPAWVLFVVALASAAALASLIDWPNRSLRLEVDPSVRALLPLDGAELATFESVRERYTSDDLLLVAWVADDLFTPARLAAIKRLTRRLERMPGVRDVESLATALHVAVYEDYSDVRGYLSDLPETIAAAEAVRDAILDNPLYAGYLVSGDGKGTMLAVRFDPELSAKTLIGIVADIEQASRYEAAGVDQFLSGPLYVRLEISRLLLRDLYRVMPLAIAMTLIVVALGFRHARGLLLPLLSNIAALVGTLAIFVANGHTLNYVTVILPPTIYVVGFAYAIHVVSDFDRHFHVGTSRAAAAAAALAEVAMPVTLTALTTAIGFASLTFSDIASIRLFGLYASLGTLLAWLATLSVVPAGLMLMPARPTTGQAVQTSSKLAVWLASTAQKRGRPMLAAGILLTLVAVYGTTRIEVGTDYLDNFAEKSTLRQNFERMSSVFSGAVPLQIVLDSDTVDVMKTPRALREVNKLKEWLLLQPEIGGVYTLLDYIGVLERALAPELIDDDPVPESAGLTSHLILLGGGEDIRRFAEPGFTSTLLQVRARVVASADLNALSARIEQRLTALPEDLRGAVTGSSYLIARTLDDVTRGQVKSLGAAFIPIFLILVALFRSVRLALLALVPNVLPILAFFGILGFSGITLNLTTSLVASVVLGIAVDDSIHFFARLRAAARDCDDDGEALERALIGIIRPVSFTTAGLALGFVTLIVGELRSQAEFGILAAATLVVAWLLDLTFTPALAHRFGVARQARARSAGK